MSRRSRKRESRFEGNKGMVWLNSEVCVLLDVWAEHDIQQQLSGRLHNMCVYEKISERLMAHGIERSAEQCREKIKKLKRDYTTCTDNNYSPAFARRLLGCFDKANEVFGKCCVVKPSSVVESLVLNLGVPTASASTDKTRDEPEDKDFDFGVEPVDRPGRENSPNMTKAMMLMRKYNKIEEAMFSKSQDEFLSKLVSLERRRLARELEGERQRLRQRERLRRQQQQREFKLFRSLLTIIASRQTSHNSDFHADSSG